MTTPKAEAMEKAERMARELLHSRIHSKTKFEDTLAAAIEPLLSAEKDRDELKAMLTESGKWILFTEHRAHCEKGFVPFKDCTCGRDKFVDDLRAFLAKQGERI
jgi:hypothetical protein